MYTSYILCFSRAICLSFRVNLLSSVSSSYISPSPWLTCFSKRWAMNIDFFCRILCSEKKVAKAICIKITKICAVNIYIFEPWTKLDLLSGSSVWVIISTVLIGSCFKGYSHNVFGNEMKQLGWKVIIKLCLEKCSIKIIQWRLIVAVCFLWKFFLHWNKNLSLLNFYEFRFFFIFN